MPKKDYPTPCIRTLALPTGERSFIYETPSGMTTPFQTEEEARVFVVENKVHRKYGRVFIETAPKRFAVLIADDGGDEDEPAFEN